MAHVKSSLCRTFSLSQQTSIAFVWKDLNEMQRNGIAYLCELHIKVQTSDENSIGFVTWSEKNIFMQWLIFGLAYFTKRVRPKSQPKSEIKIQ